MPCFRHAKFHGGHEYATEYQEKEEENLINRSAWVCMVIVLKDCHMEIVN